MIYERCNLKNVVKLKIVNFIQFPYRAESVGRLSASGFGPFVVDGGNGMAGFG